MGELLQELATHIAAAVYAKRVPTEDLLGFSTLTAKGPVVTDGHLVLRLADGPRMMTNLNGGRSQTFCMLVMESYMDADGASCNRHTNTCIAGHLRQYRPAVALPWPVHLVLQIMSHVRRMHKLCERCGVYRSAQHACCLNRSSKANSSMRKL